MRNRSRYIILGMLSIKPQTGYDIAKAIKMSTGYFWNESEGQIYPELARCVVDGLATCEEINPDGNGRQKKIYSITPAGLELLRGWLKLAPQKTLIRNELLLKLFFSENIDLGASIEHLAEFVRKAEGQLKLLQDTYAEVFEDIGSFRHSKFWLLTLEYGIELTQAQLDWGRRALTKLEAGDN